MIEKSRAPRKVAIADHLWDVFQEMADQMGADREALINQAMFMFARLNGFLATAPGAGAPAVAPAADGAAHRGPVVEAVDDPDLPAEDDEPAEAPHPDTVARRREVEERVLETAAQLEKQIKGRGDGPPAPPIDDDDSVPDGLGDDIVDDDEIDDDEIDDDEIVDELMGEVTKQSLYVMAEDGELDKVDKDRFLIGRGKHCDFIIQSGKVSREHAVIVREGDDYFLEDLGSSNGTWYQKKRIKRRKIEDGDEFFICSEKVKCVVR